MKKIDINKKYLWLILILALGGVIGWCARIWYDTTLPGTLMQVRENSSSFHYINPLLLVDSPRQAPEFSSLRSKFAGFINQNINSGNAENISVYWRDLNTGKWMGVNEDDKYNPSSTLKVAVMIGYLKQADGDPNILLKSLKYTPLNDPGQHYPPAHQLLDGYYTVRELINAMIIDSDNDALTALYNNNRQAFVDVLKELQIKPPATVDDTDFISPKAYASIFRTLYSSTYLPREFSDQALQLLTYTTFKNGLVAGVPEGTVVAHKFGEHTNLNSQNNQVVNRELHDCGIVYYPNNPYFVCVMTKGQDFSKLEGVISGLSKIAYDNRP